MENLEGREINLDNGRFIVVQRVSYDQINNYAEFYDQKGEKYLYFLVSGRIVSQQTDKVVGDIESFYTGDTMYVRCRECDTSMEIPADCVKLQCENCGLRLTRD